MDNNDKKYLLSERGRSSCGRLWCFSRSSCGRLWCFSCRVFVCVTYFFLDKRDKHMKH